jgi:hypothetical protein
MTNQFQDPTPEQEAIQELQCDIECLERLLHEAVGIIMDIDCVKQERVDAFFEHDEIQTIRGDINEYRKWQ